MRLTKNDRNKLEAIHNRLEELELFCRFEEADNLIEKNRWIIDFDRAGNYIGTTSNENGWTS